MTLRGTLDTFDLRELMQMLAFNQKVGTLSLQTQYGPQSLYVDRGRCTLLATDPALHAAFCRAIRTEATVSQEVLGAAEQVATETGAYVADVLHEAGRIDAETRDSLHQEVVRNHMLDIQLGEVSGFEFHDGSARCPDGSHGVPAAPLIPVESLLLELTRRIDLWHAAQDVVPHLGVVFEGTGMRVDLEACLDANKRAIAEVVRLVDGFSTVEQIATNAGVSRFAVTQILSAMAREGGVREVATDQLLARAETQLDASRPDLALPLLRCAVTRQDAPMKARFRLADVYEVLGESEQAALTLETYVNERVEADVSGSMDALMRIMRLRDNNPHVARRICDHYLSHRPELRRRQTDAREALGLLVRHADTQAAALEAAGRLSDFIDHGDAPSEDLRLLAELYVTGGAPHLAAMALAQRAEDALAEGNVSQARELLRRAVQYDGSCATARRRLAQLDLERSRRRQRSRVRVALAAALCTAIGFVALWYTQRKSITVEVTRAERHALEAVSATERDLGAEAKRLSELLKAVGSGREGPERYIEAARAYADAIKFLAARPNSDLAAYADEIERMASPSEVEAHQARLLRLEERLGAASARAISLLPEHASRGAEALKTGVEAVESRDLKGARAALRIALALGHQDAALVADATSRLELVEEHFRRLARTKRALADAIDDKDYYRAFQVARQGIVALRDTGLEQEVPLVVYVTSEPAGGLVFLGGARTEHVTPCLVKYAPATGPGELEVRAAGCNRASSRIPGLAELIGHEPPIPGWNGELHFDLAPGVLWRNDTLAEVRDLWLDEGTLVVLRRDGRHVHAVDLDLGTELLGTKAQRESAYMLRGGQLPNGGAWRVRGTRTLRVEPPQHDVWQYRAQTAIEWSPALLGSTICVVDRVGLVLGLHATTGKELWRRAIDGVIGRPRVSQAGFLISTRTGQALALDAATGKEKLLATRAQGRAFALPLGTGVLTLLQGEDGARIHHPTGDEQIVGAAAPRSTPAPWTGPEGALWAEGTGAVFLEPAKSARALRIPTLHGKAQTWAVRDGCVFVVDKSGTLRCIRLDQPDRVAWSVALGAPVRHEPLVTDDVVILLLPSALVAVQRDPHRQP